MITLKAEDMQDDRGLHHVNVIMELDGQSGKVLAEVIMSCASLLGRSAGSLIACEESEIDACLDALLDEVKGRAVNIYHAGRVKNV